MMQTKDQKNSNPVQQEKVTPSQGASSLNGFGRRRAPRKLVKKSCKVIYDSGEKSIPANLIDISLTGCRLELSNSRKLSNIEESFDTFLLKVVSSGLERHFKVVWRFNNQIGATCTH